jgi:hypothetical protein
MNYLKSVASGFFKSCRFHEPSDNFSVKSDDADRTTDGVGKGKATWGDHYDSADQSAERT